MRGCTCGCDDTNVDLLHRDNEQGTRLPQGRMSQVPEDVSHASSPAQGRHPEVPGVSAKDGFVLSKAPQKECLASALGIYPILGHNLQ